MIPKAAELMAILAAMLFPLGLVFLKRGYEHSTPLFGTIIITAINAVVLWILAAVFTQISFGIAIVFFVIAGVVGHGIARYLQFTGVHHVGPARSTTVLASSALFGSIIAILFRGEKLSWPVLIGTFAIVGGIALLAQESKKTKWKLVYIFFPLIAALLYGIGTNIYKAGLERLPNALLSSAVGLSAALVTLLLLTIPNTIKKHNAPKVPSIRKALPLFAIAGIINTAGLFFNFESLKLGNVSVVYPLISSQPLFATLFGYLFLRSTEKISGRVVLGALIVVAGIAAITAF